MLSKINFSFDFSSLLLLRPKTQSVSEIIENCMAKASLQPWSAVLSSSGHKKNPRTENNVILHPYGCSQGLIPQLGFSDSSEKIISYCSKIFNKLKEHKNFRKEVAMSVQAIWSLQEGTQRTVLLLFTFLSV